MNPLARVQLIGRIQTCVLDHYRAFNEPVSMSTLSGKFSRACKALDIEFSDLISDLHKDGSIEITLTRSAARFVYPTGYLVQVPKGQVKL